MTRYMSRRTFVATASVVLATALVPGCASSQGAGSASGSAASSAATQKDGIDYLALVNKQHKLPDGWEDAVEIVNFKNTEDWDVSVEAKAYDAYLKLKEDLEAEGVYVDLDSAFRSTEEQQEIVDDFTKK